MAAVTIAGIDYEVRTDAARMARPRRIGSETEAFSGKLRRTVRDEFLAWEFALAPLSIAALTTLRTNAKAGFQTCSGDLLGGSFSCSVELSEAIAGDDDAEGIYWLVSVTLRQAA